METCSVVLAFKSVDEILFSVTIEMKATEQYFCMVPLVFHYFTN